MSKKKSMVIVESPAKARTIEKYLGAGYHVRASMGHVRDLPTFGLGIDIENAFMPKYKILKDKTKVVKDLESEAKKSTEILLATDPDREGEAIAWHIQEALDIPKERFRRIVFNEITKDAVRGAIENARDIDEDLVNAQQARRILDRLIGYKLSPILSKKIQKGLSAGRVQSVALRILCDRENEIMQFIPTEYWIIDVLTSTPTNQALSLKLATQDGKKLEIPTETDAKALVKQLKASKLEITEVKKSRMSRNPSAPFITSTLQQDAARKMGWSSKKTMVIAQQLYEGVSVNGESTGLITYMRTDSTRISDEAKTTAKTLIENRFGPNYWSGSTKKSTGKLVQDAHEAIRPSSVALDPAQLKDKISEDHWKLYQLIWDRMVASQMAPAQLDLTQVSVTATSNQKPLGLRASGSIMVFDGYTRLYTEGQEEDAGDGEGRLPEVAEGTVLSVNTIRPEQKFTQPPRRFSESSLIKEMEENGIGRPSTYSPTINLILDRGYVEREKKILKPTELGMTVNTQLLKFFSGIIDVQFTASMENRLDEIMEGKHSWVQIIQDFYEPFEKLVTVAADKMDTLKMDKPTDEICDKCGKNMVIKRGRYGEFISCADYPNCKNTKSIVTSTNIQCPKDGGAMVEKRSKKGKLFYGCGNFPTCNYATWDPPVPGPCPECEFPILTQKASAKNRVCPECKAKVDPPTPATA